MTATPVLKTFLWFPGNMDEALDFYKEVMGAEVHSENRPNGRLFTVDFTIYGHDFVGMNWPGGPAFNDSISLSLNVDGQDEVDRLWNAITKDGQPGRCGWCKDAWGVSWQVSPIQMRDFLENWDPEVSSYANEALRNMTKIIIADFVKP